MRLLKIKEASRIKPKKKSRRKRKINLKTKDSAV